MEKYISNMEKCCQCGIYIDNTVKAYSVRNYYGYSLCIDCQNKIKRKMARGTTIETIKLYLALRQRDVPAELEKFDRHKHIDMAVPTAKLNIEVDGLHHNFDTKQALADLERTYHSFRKGFYTIRIPNSLVCDDDILSKTANYLIKFVKYNRDILEQKQ